MLQALRPFLYGTPPYWIFIPSLTALSLLSGSHLACQSLALESSRTDGSPVLCSDGQQHEDRTYSYQQQPLYLAVST